MGQVEQARGRQPSLRSAAVHSFGLLHACSRLLGSITHRTHPADGSLLSCSTRILHSRSVSTLGVTFLLSPFPRSCPHVALPLPASPSAESRVGAYSRVRAATACHS